MRLLALTVLLLAICSLSVVAPGAWQGMALLLVVVAVALHAHRAFAERDADQ